jgi:hypothetical protein
MMSPEPSLLETKSRLPLALCLLWNFASQAGNDNIDWDFMISSLPKPLREGFLPVSFRRICFQLPFLPLGSTI